MVRVYANCWLCERIMPEAFTCVVSQTSAGTYLNSRRYLFKISRLICGHAYCGPCLRAHFEQKLVDTLGHLAKEKGVPRQVFMPIPTTLAQGRHLAVVVRSHGYSAADIFKYPCPSVVCGQDANHAPIRSFCHGDFNKSMALAVTRHAGQQLDYAPEVGDGYFAGLFF